MNSIMSQQGCLYTTEQLKGKLSRLRRAWRLLNDMITKGTGWGWNLKRNTITDDVGLLEELYQLLPIIWQAHVMREVPRQTPQAKARGHQEFQKGAEWIAEIMTTPHQGRFFDNIHMTKPYFNALVDALTSRGLLPHGLRRSYGRHVSTGSAADARVLDHAVSQDPTFPFLPIGKYYLVDAGFTNYQCFLAPYRGTRYNLP
ncbi:hypothetical protein Sango_1601000 [Sesamum angolense]|uniref:DDE Tnp4 domain-containing protein n=1 Tax=Sesamum angolense TaxID=2727404 RepID=A0AAE1WJR8_9LAMI|nr:hypothetical protein Sango_1601000 [Sesamum angolense]